MSNIREKGFATLLMLGIVIAVAFLVTGYYYLSTTNRNFPGKQYVQKVYTPEESKEETLSDSDDTAVIEMELNETDLGTDNLEKDLDDIDKDLKQL